MHLSDTQPTRPKKTLGSKIAKYSPQKITWQVILIWVIAAGLFIFTPLITGIWRVQYARLQYGPVAAQVWGIPWFIASMFGCIPFGYLVLKRIYKSRHQITIYQQGLLIHAGWREKLVIPWKKISGISVVKVRNTFLGIKFRNQYQIKLYPTVGKSIRFSNHIQGLDELSARIKAKIYPKMIKELRNTFQNGHNLYFGEITINRRGIKIQSKEFPWEQVSLINIRSGFLVVELKNQRPKKISVGKIPNIELVLQIIHEGVEA